MIIKSMARKQPSFGQLIAYMDRDADRGSGLIFARNLYCDLADKNAVAAEFTRNHSHLPKRKRGNALYHELIVLERTDGVGEKRLTRILGDLAERYLQARAPDHLAYARVHHDTDNAHIHIMISSNAIRSDRRKRLTRTQFTDIQREIEAQARERYPELGITRIYDRTRSNDRLKIRTRENAAERRTKQPSKKTIFREAIETALAQAHSGDDLNRRLADQGLELYQRGKTIGVVDQSSGKRYRLKTLGLESIFEKTRNRFDWEAERVEVLTQKRLTAESAREITSAEKLLRRREALEREADEHLREFEDNER